MLFTLVFTIIILCYVLIHRNFYNKSYWKKKNVVQTNFNLMLKFVFGKQSMPEILRDIYNDHPDVLYVGTIAGTTPTLLLKHPDDVQAVLAGDFQSFHSRGIKFGPHDLLADNLLFMNDVKRWKLLRQKLSPVFTTFKLKYMFKIIEKVARDFVEVVEDDIHLRKDPFNILYTYTTASIGASVFGIDTQNNRNAMDSPFLEMTQKTLKPSLYSNIAALLANTSPRLYDFLNIKVFGEHEEFFIGAVRAVLEERQRKSIRTHDFIDLCLGLQLHGFMHDFSTNYSIEPTVEVLAAQAFFFFLAGTDTSANTMHYTLLELSNNPEVLVKVHEEIDRVFDECNEEFTYNEVEKLQYLDQCVNEAMRKYPTIGVIQRLCTKDTVLPSGVAIEKDEIVMISPFAMHRDEKYFPEPDKFDPDRFSPENVSKIPKYVFLPFGEGNRICIGVRFARLQVKAGLAWLLRRFTLGEQNCTPTFERSPFGLRSPTDKYELKLRD
ncbi:cytochrome P450 6B5 [Spodoptera frugiperda]|uniref:unspecific monooxygenase n=1 Tax=Spodoptera frugiperda TaxID=7108 RepID=A0A9R0EFK1_SPOFR|nr:cytochrome P450 6B5 [Spodoptera frugiperda]ULR85516.1 cytochrome P450 [Spodoptera frugiperda]ULR85525.1 cytochrome P450 [Spodoptera frugiperda]